MCWWSGLKSRSRRMGLPSTTGTVSYRWASWEPSTRTWGHKTREEERQASLRPQWHPHAPPGHPPLGMGLPKLWLASALELPLTPRSLGAEDRGLKGQPLEVLGGDSASQKALPGERETERDIIDVAGWGMGVTSKGEEVFRMMTMSWNETAVRGGEGCTTPRTY